MAKEFVVIGLGQFGRAVALNLARQGHSVLAVDRDMACVESIADEVDSAVALDTTDEKALLDLPLKRMSCAVVTIGGESLEASILTTALLRQMGVPRIIGRATTDLHGRVLRAAGAHEIINPEEEMGRRLALRLAHPGILDQLQLGSVYITEIAVPKSIVGQTLKEIDMRNRFGVSILAIRRPDDLKANPQGSDRIESGDILVVMGEPQAVDRLASLH